MATINSFPNNADEYIGAEEVMRWLHGRTSGVYGDTGNAVVSAVQNAMAVSVAKGIGWLTDADGNGIVWWSGSATQLTIDAAEPTGTLNRIDRVIVRWYIGDYSDKPELLVLKGTNASVPTPPSINTDARYKEISLARVSIPAGTTAITPMLITDERYDASVCGVVTETVTLETTTIQNQFEAFLAAIEEELAELEAGTAVELKKVQFNNVTVPTSAWAADTTYEDFGFKGTVALTGVTANMIPEVMFGVADSASGTFSAACESYNGGIYLYANDIPASAITIPVIILWRSSI